MSQRDEEGWDQWRQHVLAEIKRLNRNVYEHQQNFQEERLKMWKQIERLNVKSGLWGLVGGVLATIPPLVYAVIKFGH